MKKSNKEIRKEVTSTILEALRKGTSPWQRPWTPEGGDMWPHNCITGHNYTGVNFPVLLAIQSNKEYPTAQWLTFNQMRKAGGRLRKLEDGEKQRASYVVFAKPLIVKDRTDPEKKVKIFFLRQTPVFNIAQTEGVKLPKRELPDPKLAKAKPDSKIIRETKAFMKDVGVKVRYNGGRAFYSLTKDVVELPKPESFKEAEGFAATAYHETVHWTGHKDRCGRDMKGTFGSKDYAFEELVAELGSAMLCHKRGVSSEQPQHASYIKSWIKKLEEDEQYIFKAAKLSEAALNHLLPETARKQEKEVA